MQVRYAPAGPWLGTGDDHLRPDRFSQGAGPRRLDHLPAHAPAIRTFAAGRCRCPCLNSRTCRGQPPGLTPASAEDEPFGMGVRERTSGWISRPGYRRGRDRVERCGELPGPVADQGTGSPRPGHRGPSRFRKKKRKEPIRSPRSSGTWRRRVDPTPSRAPKRSRPSSSARTSRALPRSADRTSTEFR
jgi:hypothetical protein